MADTHYRTTVADARDVLDATDATVSERALARLAVDLNELLDEAQEERDEARATLDRIRAEAHAAQHVAVEAERSAERAASLAYLAGMGEAAEHTYDRMVQMAHQNPRAIHGAAARAVGSAPQVKTLVVQCLRAILHVAELALETGRHRGVGRG